MTEDEYPLITGYFGETPGDLAHWNVLAAGDLTNREFARFADIKQHVSRLFDELRGFGDVDLKGDFHGGELLPCADGPCVQVQFAVDEARRGQIVGRCQNVL